MTDVSPPSADWRDPDRDRSGCPGRVSEGDGGDAAAGWVQRTHRDEDFSQFYPARGQPGLAPWRLALVTVLQFLENLSDRQAADAVRARIDWKYALGLDLTDPGFHFSVLTEFRARLVAGGGEHLLLDTMLERLKERGLVKA